MQLVNAPVVMHCVLIGAIGVLGLSTTESAAPAFRKRCPIFLTTYLWSSSQLSASATDITNETNIIFRTVDCPLIGDFHKRRVRAVNERPKCRTVQIDPGTNGQTRGFKPQPKATLPQLQRQTGLRAINDVDEVSQAEKRPRSLRYKRGKLTNKRTLGARDTLTAFLDTHQGIGSQNSQSTAYIGNPAT